MYVSLGINRLPPQTINGVYIESLEWKALLIGTLATLIMVLLLVTVASLVADMGLLNNTARFGPHQQETAR